MNTKTLIRLDQFMAAANAVYYANKDPFSDFTTAPEISQMFGELIAAWVITVRRSISEDMPVYFAEAGPGRGTLMTDLLRVMRQVAFDLYQRCSIYLIETSPRLREQQQVALQEHHTIPIYWLDSIEDLPKEPIILLANEFLDALPIRQFIRLNELVWAEHYVKDHQLIQQPVQSLPDSPIFSRPISIGGVVEICEPAQYMVHYLARRIRTYGGLALFIDYGYAQPVWGDSLQAIAGKKSVSPFVTMGSADLTAHVDFCSLKEIALQAGATVYGIQTQRQFLLQLGLPLRAQILLEQANSKEKKQIQSEVYRLVAAEQMGDLFKVMAICSPDFPLLPGFM